MTSLKKNILIKMLLMLVLFFFVTFLFFNEAHKKAVEKEKKLYPYPVISPDPVMTADQHTRLNKMICEISKNTPLCKNPISFSFECKGDEEDCLFFKEILEEDPRIFYSDNNPSIKISGVVFGENKKYHHVSYSFQNLDSEHVKYIFGPGIDAGVMTRDLRSVVRFSLAKDFF
jgi:hypothetical protein